MERNKLPPMKEKPESNSQRIRRINDELSQLSSHAAGYTQSSSQKSTLTVSITLWVFSTQCKKTLAKSHVFSNICMERENIAKHYL